MKPFNDFTQDMINHLLPGQKAYQDLLLDTAGAYERDSVSASGACSLTTLITELTISGTKAYTLAAPTYAGQMKTVKCIVAGSTPAGTLTVSSPDDTAGFVCPATFFFDTAGQEITFRATPSLKWRAIQKKRVGVKTLTVGTTETTGICDMSHVTLAVTASVASTTTKALPNGAAVGELCSVQVSTAASTPHGDLGGTFLSKAGVAGTTLDDFVAVTDSALLQWTGSAWQVLSLSGSALAVV